MVVIKERHHKVKTGSYLLLLGLLSLFFLGYQVKLGAHQRTRRKIIIFGPHDRYNFGDLLFTKTLKRLLQVRSGYDPSDILYGGIVSVDMSKHGGEVNILNMKIIQEMSRSDKIKGPYDIIYSGGEASGCDHSCGVGMLPTQEMMAQAIANKIYDCAYLVPKHLLVVPETDGQVPTNHAIVNNMGGKPIPSCKLAIDTADFQGFRDRDPLYPDSAIMIKKLYEKEIKEKSNEVLQDLFQNTSKKKS